MSSFSRISNRLYQINRQFLSIFLRVFRHVQWKLPTLKVEQIQPKNFVLDRRDPLDTWWPITHKNSLNYILMSFCPKNIQRWFIWWKKFEFIQSFFFSVKIFSSSTNFSLSTTSSVQPQSYIFTKLFLYVNKTFQSEEERFFDAPDGNKQFIYRFFFVKFSFSSLLGMKKTQNRFVCRKHVKFADQWRRFGSSFDPFFVSLRGGSAFGSQNVFIVPFPKRFTESWFLWGHFPINFLVYLTHIKVLIMNRQ